MRFSAIIEKNLLAKANSLALARRQYSKGENEMDERHEEETTRNIGLLISGFALGAITGTILGLLFAPKAGKELREDIKEKSSEFYGLAKEKVKEGLEVSKEKIGEAFEKVKKAVQTGTETIKEKLAQESKGKEES